MPLKRESVESAIQALRFEEKFLSEVHNPITKARFKAAADDLEQYLLSE